MSRITGGTVHVLRRVNLGNNEHKEAGVDLTFGVNEDEDHGPILASASSEAHAHVEAILAGKIPAPAAGRATKAPKAEPKVGKSQDTSEPSPGVSASTPAVTETTNAGGQAAVDEMPEDVGPTTPSGSAPDVAGVDAMPEETTAREITDKELATACDVCNKRTSNPTKIRELIVEMANPPGGSKNIPQAKRQAFLDGLLKIPAAAA